MRCSKTILFAILALMCAALIGACGPSTQAASSEKTPFKFGLIPWAGYASIYIAEDKGFFSQQGVEVEIVPYALYDEMTAAFAEKRSDVAVLVMADAVSQAAAGIPVVGVWSTDTSVGADVMVATPEITTVADLRGKRVAFTYGTFSQVFVARTLENAGLTLDDVTVVNLSYDAVPEALKKGEIDAGHTYDPYIQPSLAAGAQIIATSKDTPEAGVELFSFHKTAVEEHPKDIQAILKAMSAAMDWWALNQDEGNQIIAKYIGVQAEDMPAILGGLKILNLQDNLAIFDANNPGSLYANAQFVSDLFLESQIIKQSPDADSFIDPSFVQAMSSQ